MKSSWHSGSNDRLVSLGAMATGPGCPLRLPALRVQVAPLQHQQVHGSMPSVMVLPDPCLVHLYPRRALKISVQYRSLIPGVMGSGRQHSVPQRLRHGREWLYNPRL